MKKSLFVALMLLCLCVNFADAKVIKAGKTARYENGLIIDTAAIINHSKDPGSDSGYSLAVEDIEHGIVVTQYDGEDIIYSGWRFWMKEELSSLEIYVDGVNVLHPDQASFCNYYLNDPSTPLYDGYFLCWPAREITENMDNVHEKIVIVTAKGETFEKEELVSYDGFIGTADVSKAGKKLLENKGNTYQAVEDNVKVELYDALGKMLQKKYLKKGEEITIENLPAKLLLLKATDGKTVQTEKLIKQK